MHGDLLNLIRDQDRRSTSIYTLSRIVKDTGAGADLFGRITAFLKA
jgi:diacylglycerol kinase